MNSLLKESHNEVATKTFSLIPCSPGNPSCPLSILTYTLFSGESLLSPFSFEAWESSLIISSHSLQSRESWQAIISRETLVTRATRHSGETSISWLTNQTLKQEKVQDTCMSVFFSDGKLLLNHLKIKPKVQPVYNGHM
jgi:hypothetical protein